RCAGPRGRGVGVVCRELTVHRPGPHPGRPGPPPPPHAHRAGAAMTEQPGIAVLRPHAEQKYSAELAALAAGDERPRPPNWRLSPWAVVTYLLGGTLSDGTPISPKYVGQRRLVEIAVATLATDRALLLL